MLRAGPSHERGLLGSPLNLLGFREHWRLLGFGSSCERSDWGTTGWSGSRGGCWLPVPTWALCRGHGAVPSPRLWNNPQPGANRPSTKPQKPRAKDKPLSQYLTGPGQCPQCCRALRDSDPQGPPPDLSCPWGGQEQSLLQPEGFGDSRRGKDLCPWDGKDVGDP